MVYVIEVIRFSKVPLYANFELPSVQPEIFGKNPPVALISKKQTFRQPVWMSLPEIPLEPEFISRKAVVVLNFA
jgi:hypothetical protein